MLNNRAQLLITAVDQTRQVFSSVQGHLSRLRSEAQQVGQTLARLGATIGVGLGVRELAEIADQYKHIQARLRLAI